MIYITGDCHADFRKFSTDAFPEQSDMTSLDYVIVCGDFGLWHDTQTERWWLKWLSEKKFTLLFVDGNHENFDRLYSNEFKVVDFHGGRAHKIRDNIYHLMRGYVFNLCGKKIFAFGGASSHDISDGILDIDDYKTDADFKKVYNKMTSQNKMFRVNHLSWWEEELPNDKELERGIHSLYKCGNSVDYIISHCAPQEIASIMSNGYYKSDKLTEYLNVISLTVKFDKWFFGHYHRDEMYMQRYVALYDQIVRVV